MRLPDGRRITFEELIGRPSQLEFQSISCPVSFWYGDADRIASPEFGAVLARTVPKAELRLVAGAGHLFLFSEFRQIVPWLARFKERAA